MEELLNLIAEGDEEEDLLGEDHRDDLVRAVAQLTVEISVADGPDLGTWLIRCENNSRAY